MLPEQRVDPRRLLLPNLEGKYSLQIQTLTSCNARCAFCPHPDSWGRLPVKRMCESTFDRILSQMKSFEFYKVAPYLQNEPLNDERVFDFIGRIAHELTFDLIEISTNPLALTQKHCHKLKDSLYNLSHEIRISFHGSDSTSFEQNMGLDFERAVSNVVYMLHLAEKADLYVTLKGLGARRGALRGAGVEFSEEAFKQFWRRVCLGHGLSYERLNLKYGAFHSRSDNVSRARNLLASIVRPDLQGFYCTRVDRWFHFIYSGVLVLCCNDYFQEEPLGDITKLEIGEILGSKSYQSIYAQVTGEMPSPREFLCKRCTSPGG